MSLALLIGCRPHHARYLKRYKSALETVAPGVQTFVTGPNSDFFESREIDTASYVGVPWIPLSAARTKRWDCVIYSIHAKLELHHPAVHCFLGHGIDVGDHPYNGCHTYNNRHNYDVITFKSSAEYHRALRYRPDIRGRLHKTGDPLVDELVECDLQRNDIRKRLGYCTNDIVVALLSSWGRASKVADWLGALSAGTKRLPSRVKLLLFSHPNNYLMLN